MLAEAAKPAPAPVTCPDALYYAGWYQYYHYNDAFTWTIGAIGGQVPIDLLTALPGRLVNLLESDLVQAIPLYVVMAGLINRLPAFVRPLARSLILPAYPGYSQALRDCGNSTFSTCRRSPSWHSK